ncbi:MAG: MFS transporter [Deltaproteobacteria bacterium]|nr:MFS transporter [Deltaproteobacteria bacterium]
MDKQDTTSPRNAASWLGINRATLAVLVVTAGLGMSEEVWRSFLAIHLKDTAQGVDQVLAAAKYMGLFAALVNLMEGFGYMVGGAVAHRMGARTALLVSAAPMLAGFCILLLSHHPLLIVAGALLLTNWEALSVPATFDVVGSEVPKDRRTIAFAMQSIQKRLPKVLGPLIGGLVISVGFWVNLTAAFGLVVVASIIQFLLLARMKPKSDPKPVPWRELMRRIPPELRTLLTAEILLRWGDWFVRDFAVLYVVGVLLRSNAEAGVLVAVTSLTALVTYVPMGKLVDRASSPKPFIGLTFALFALFPINLVFLPKLLPRVGVPVMGALVVVFVLNGLRELGEPARKALIAGGFAPEVRARSVGLYWGLRSFAFFPAPFISYLLWSRVGPEATFLIGGGIGLLGTAWFWLRMKR